MGNEVDGAAQKRIEKIRTSLRIDIYLKNSLTHCGNVGYTFSVGTYRRRAMIQNKIVVRYQDGRVMKGFTADFMPNKDIFHLVPMDAPPDTKPLPINVQQSKALFFVKDFAGDSQYHDKKTFEPNKPATGRKIKVVFKDGEVLVGTTQGYQPGRPGFFVFPADPQSNIERCYVVSAATREVSFV